MNTQTIILLTLLSAAFALILYLVVRLRGKEAELTSALFSPKEDQLTLDYIKAATDQSLYDRCCKYMMDKRPFLIDDYTLQDLARAMCTNKVYLSKTINKFSGKNFRQYINYYRIIYSMELYRGNTSLKIQEMSELSGFHSTTSFYQSFKTVMRETPREWCSRVRRQRLNSKTA